MTQDAFSIQSLIQLLSLSNDSNTLVIGPSGSGKSSICTQSLISSHDYSKINENIMLSGQMSGKQALSLVLSKIEKRRKGIYGPPLGKKLILFVDDLNAPKVEEYGAQSALEMMRQVIEIKGW